MNKKMFALYFFMIFAVISFLLLPNKKPLFDDSALNGKNLLYTFYTLEKMDSDLPYTKNGDAFVHYCDFKNASKVKQQLSGILGESVSFCGDKVDGLNFLSNFDYTTILVENIDGIWTLYAYSPKIENFVFVNNQKVNIELAVNKNIVTIGSPIIVGSY